MKKRRFLAAFTAILISTGAFAQTAEEIADKYVAALGSPDKLKEVKTVITDISLAIQGNEIPIKTFLVVGKAVRSETSIMGNSMIQVLDGSSAWMIRPAMMGGSGEPEDMPAEQLQQMQGQLDPFGPLYNWKEKENKLELIGKEKVGKKEAYRLKVTTKGGITMDQFIDASTFMILKTTVNAAGQSVEIGYDDYKEVAGIKIAHLLEMSSPMGAMSMITNKVKINDSIDESIFKRPK